MPIDRAEVLKKAEKLLRTGKLDLAIAEYVRLIEEHPRDWNTRNTLGDLYVRANKPNDAVAQYEQIADHLVNEGFYSKAAALYKKILKITPDEESVQMQLGEISAKQGLLADAKGYFVAIGAKRQARGDRAGAAEITVRLGSLDPADFDARALAARTLAEYGELIAAAMRYRSMHADLLDKGRKAEAMAALREAVRCNEADVEGRAELARAAVADGDFDAARTYLDRSTAGSDAGLQFALVQLEIRSGNLAAAREILAGLLKGDSSMRSRVVDLTWTLAAASPEGAYACIETAVDVELAARNYMDAAALLHEYTTRVSGQVVALRKLVEICVDGGLEATMYETQAQLADAYLEQGEGTEARVIAEDLVAREPWEHSHIDRFRRALILLNVPDPDAVIADRLSGQGPFIATDPFMAPESFGDPEPPILRPYDATREAPVTDPEPPAQPKPVPEREPAPPPATVKKAAPPQDLDDVFTTRRTEVSRQAGVKEATEQLALAHTYLEMSMTDEAMAALKKAVKIPTHRFEAASLLGRLYLKNEDPAGALEWLERASEAPAPSPKEGRALLYDLGATLEATGDVSRALAVFMELRADAGDDYRDVAARVDRLARVQTGG